MSEYDCNCLNVPEEQAALRGLRALLAGSGCARPEVESLSGGFFGVSVPLRGGRSLLVVRDEAATERACEEFAGTFGDGAYYAGEYFDADGTLLSPQPPLDRLLDRIEG